MVQVQIRIRFLQPGRSAELEVTMAPEGEASNKIWRTLDGLRILPWSAYLIRTPQRLVTRARLTEQDGSAVCQQRAGEVMEALRVALARRSDAPATDAGRPSEPQPGRCALARCAPDTLHATLAAHG